MSLTDAVKLENLKIQAEKILTERAKVISTQRPKVLQVILTEMKDYLSGQGFSIVDARGPNRGFTAKYNEIQIEVSSTRDDEEIIGADYVITIEYAKKFLTVQLLINRGTYVAPVMGADINKKIQDYETRYIPSLEALSLGELDGSYTLFIYSQSKSSRQTINLPDGKACIDKLFENI